MGVVLAILVTYGISNIIIWGSIFEGFREFWKKWSPNFFGVLFTCMICLPTWIGFFLSAGANLTGYEQFSPFGSQGLDIIPITIFLDGCLLSGTTWLINTIQEYFENNQSK
jgi:hypothetical protein